MGDLSGERAEFAAKRRDLGTFRHRSLRHCGGVRSGFRFCSLPPQKRHHLKAAASRRISIICPPRASTWKICERGAAGRRPCRSHAPPVFLGHDLQGPQGRPINTTFIPRNAYETTSLRRANGKLIRISRALRTGPVDFAQLRRGVVEVPHPAKVADLGFQALRHGDDRAHPVARVVDVHRLCRIRA